MLRRCRVPASIACSLLLLVGVPFAAAGGRDEDLFVRPEDQHVVLFGSLDAGRSSFVSGGSKQTLVGPLDRTGFVLMETTGFGLTRERYRTEEFNVPALRFVHQAALLAGFQWAQDGLFVAALAGPEGHREQLAVAGRIDRISQPRLGLRGQIEVWAPPTPGALFTTTLVSGSTRASLWARASAGLRLFGDAFVGPEVTTYVTPTYTEVRWGGHVTGVRAGLLTVRLSAGWMSDDAHRRGSPYAGLTAWIRL